MRLRQLVLALGLASLLVSSLTNALGLGEVTLNSTLNQPLNAEIKLLDTRDLTAEQIVVSLASPADFERNGVDRLFFYTEFQFQIDLQSPRGPIVRITSRNPVREPYLNFLIEARWTAGRLLREYTLLMDLPTYDDEKQVRPSVAPSVPDTKPTTQGKVNRVPPTTEPTRSRAQSTPRTAQNGEYTIRPNDTLWEIAAAVRPEVSVHQAMVSLYEANPEAFIGGNISRLREGRVLRVPDASQMTSLSKSEAISQFSQLESGMGAQLTASRRTNTEATEPSDISGRVTLAASNTSPTTSTGQGSGADNGSGRALESELASTLEELDRVKSENTELTSRVRDLESQIQTMEKMVEVSNENLRALELSAEKVNQEKANNTQPEPSTPVEVPVESTASSVSTEVAAETPVTESQKPETKPQKQPVKPKLTPKPAAKPATLVDKLIANAPWIGVGVVVLGGLIGFVLYRRRKQSQTEEYLFDTQPTDDDLDLNYNPSLDQDDTYDEPEPEPVDDFDTDTDTDDEVNPADKADIFIAYGQLEKAENLLLKGLEKDPDSSDIRLKLLEVYAQQQDVSKFDKHYAALIPIAASAVLSRASELRSHIPDAGDFDMPDYAPDFSDEPAVKAQQMASLDDLELDLDDDIYSGREEKSNLAQDDDFTLDLDEPRHSDDTVIMHRPRATETVEADDDLELDLNFGDTELETDSYSSEELSLDDQADDIGEINLALDELDDDSSDDLQLIEPEEEPSLKPVKPASQELDLDDDFNLDLDSDNVDLAALDDEMSSLDTDFTDTELEGDFSLDDDNFTLEDSELIDDSEEEFLIGEELDLETGSSESDDELEFNLDDSVPETPAKPASQSLRTVKDEPVSDESLFEQALSDIDDQGDVALTDFDTGSDQDLESDDLDFLAEADEAATKLDLARAYIDMGDMTGARDILSEVVSEGTDEQKREAKDLLSRIDA
jgi:pilus assembly protein FimV